MSGLKRYAQLFTALLISAGAAAQSSDDTLTLVSGEILRGDLLDISDDVVSFKTRHGSRTYLPFDQIQSLRTAKPRLVTMTSGETIHGQLSVTDRKLILDGEDGVTTIEVANIASVAAFTPSDDPSPGLHASTGTGVLLRNGNQSRVDLYAKIELARIAPQYEWRWETLLALDGGDSFPNFLLSEFEWRGIQRERRDMFVLAGVERDRDAALDSRLYGAVGVDYEWLWDSPKSEFRGGVGLGVTRDALDANGTMRAIRWRKRDHAHSETDLDLLFRVIYKSQLHDHLTFQDELRVLPSLTNVGDVRASYDSGLAWSLLDGLDLNLQLRIDYDDDPPFEGIDHWRAVVGAGFRVRFGPR